MEAEFCQRKRRRSCTIFNILSGGVAVFTRSEEEEESDVAEVPRGIEAGLVPTDWPLETGDFFEDARGNRPLPIRVRVLSPIGLEHVAEERSEK